MSMVQKKIVEQDYYRLYLLCHKNTQLPLVKEGLLNTVTTPFF